MLLQYLDTEYKIKPSEILFVFDDVLDLSLAKLCGIRFLVKRPASQLFESFVIENHYTDFISTFDGSNHAIREICEFTLQKLNFSGQSNFVSVRQRLQNFLRLRVLFCFVIY